MGSTGVLIFEVLAVVTAREMLIVFWTGPAGHIC